MTWTPIISGKTGAGKALFACPKCGKTSDAGKFEINNATKSMQCMSCTHKGAIEAFRVFHAPSGHAEVSDLVTWGLLAVACVAVCFAAWMLSFSLLYARASIDAEKDLASAQKSAERLQEIRADERERACRRKMAALARALDWRDFPIPERAEDFYQGCLRVYDEAWSGRK